MVNAFSIYHVTDGAVHLPTDDLVSQYNAQVQNVRNLKNAIAEDEKDQVAAAARDNGTVAAQ
jgi:hypothetical protein